MFSKRLKELRLEKDLTQTELGEAVGLSQSTIGAYENNEREPNFEKLLELAKYFRVTTDYLLGVSPYRSWQLWKESAPVVNLEDFVVSQSNINLMGEPLEEGTKKDILLFLRTAHEYIKMKKDEK
jgi:transcriptional regulator with XRE-family HTH domain